MAIKNEITIVTRAEQADLYSPPIFSIEEQRLYFSLNDAELAVFRSIRLRAHRCYFVAILGYFKSKPVILDIAYSQVSKDLMFISKELLGGKGLRPFTPSQKQKDRLYAKVLDLAGLINTGQTKTARRVIVTGETTPAGKCTQRRCSPY